MQAEEALRRTGPLLLSVCHGVWTPVPNDVMLEVLKDWRHHEGSEFVAQVVSVLERGHPVSSPGVPSFRYKVASLAGQQEQLL